jgi:hypothetical protein
MLSMAVDINTRRELSEPHPNEIKNRQIRAFALVNIVRRFRVYTSQVERMDERQWNMLGEAAEINLPISRETKDLTISLLKLVRSK